jgi:hypothetical protein
MMDDQILSRAQNSETHSFRYGCALKMLCIYAAAMTGGSEARNCLVVGLTVCRNDFPETMNDARMHSTNGRAAFKVLFSFLRSRPVTATHSR